MDRDPAPGNRTFVKRQLASGEDSPPSIPLAVPSSLIYDEHTNMLHKRDSTNATQDGCSDGGPLYMIPKALEMLKSIEKPVAVLSICGPYRSGKSYILSRILGVQDAFGVGHTMKQSTHGIWLANTALECDDFVVVFLDTEGTDQAGASDAEIKCNFSLVVMTVLISSTLIYNSTGVPKRSDIEAMSFFAQLSSMVMPNQDRSADFDFSSQFPKFHWLFRDVLLPPVDDNGDIIPLTEYIKTNVLLRELSSSTKTQSVVSALLNLFPSFDCHMLPIPSNKRDVLRTITENESKLSTEFNEDVHKLRLDILNSVEAKKPMTGGDQQYMNGSMICQLLDVCLASLSAPNVIPDLTCGWLAAMRNKLETLLVKLFHDYLQEIEQALSCKGVIEESIPANFEPPSSPVEEVLALIHENESENEVFETEARVSPEPALSVCSRRSTLRSRTSPKSRSSSMSSIITPIQVTASRTLIGIHQSILNSKLKEFRREINRCMGAVSEEEKSVLLSRLERKIVQYDRTPEGNCSACVVGGELLKYIQKNYEASKERCSQTFGHVIEPLKDNLTRAVDSVHENYYTMAVGPAKDEVFEMKMREFEEVASRLSPGPPRNLRVVGLANNKTKIKWSRPNIHPRAVKGYEVQVMLRLKQHERSEWKPLLTDTKRRATIVTNLTPSTTYLFRVRAKNTNQIGEWSSEIEVTTRMGQIGRYGASAAGFVAGSVSAPIMLTGETFKQGIQAFRESETTAEKVQTGVGMVAGGLLLPFILLSETLLLTTTTGCDVAESVYESTGTTNEDNFDENKTEVVSILPTKSEISSSTSSSSSGYNSNPNSNDQNVSPTSFTVEQESGQPEEESCNRVEEEPSNHIEFEGEPNNLEDRTTGTEFESKTITPIETTVEFVQNTVSGHAGEHCVHYQLNVEESNGINVDEISTESDTNTEAYSVTKEKRPNHLDTHAASQSVSHQTSNGSHESGNIKLAATTENQIDSPTIADPENSLGCILHSFAFSD